jgi:hypothetical protein
LVSISDGNDFPGSEEERLMFVIKITVKVVHNRGVGKGTNDRVFGETNSEFAFKRANNVLSFAFFASN